MQYIDHLNTYKVIQTENILLKNISRLEKIILEQLASCDGMDEDCLHLQIAMTKVESRSYSRIGFTTYFSLPDGIPILHNHVKGNLPNVYVEHPDMPAGAGFMVHIENGKLKSIEGYALTGKWPKDEFKFHILTDTH
jgi:hypothetical protein